MPIEQGDEAATQQQAMAFAKQVATDVDQIIPR
jgi:hypothetical protein